MDLYTRLAICVGIKYIQMFMTNMFILNMKARGNQQKQATIRVYRAMLRRARLCHSMSSVCLSV